MDTTEPRPSVPMGVGAAVALNGLFLLGNGLFMIVAPLTWYYLVPGVTDTGAFNQHFVRDIGIIQAFLGAAFVLGLSRPALRIDLWAAATAWLIAHALFHFWEVAVGICGPSVLVRDFPAVTLPALIGVALTTWAWGASPRPRREDLHAAPAAQELRNSR